MTENLVLGYQDLRIKIEGTKSILKDCPPDDSSGVMVSALRHCLVRTIDLAEGCASVAEAHLPQALASLCRSLYETFLRTRWVSLSEENAQHFKETGINLLRKSARKILRNGFGKIIPNADALQNPERTSIAIEVADKFKEYLLTDKIPEAEQWTEVAKQAGLERLHTSMYDFFSIMAHGSTFGFDGDLVGTSDHEMFSLISSANVFVAAINFISKCRIIYHQEATPSQIDAILRFDK